jgi:serine/threonine-protein kinase
MAEQPQRIGKYDIVDVLGRGAMGVVYRGHDPYVDRPVAIKVASNVGIEGAQSLARRMFINEARSAGRLDHPNILKVYEAGEEGGQPYMVMEYIAGGDTLRNYCKAGSLLPLAKVLDIIRQAADALDYAHGQGVLHRDIKPANLMLTRDGHTKLGDFGIARRADDEQAEVTGWFGSPLYMSPEQAQDLEMTAQSDLFSLGAVFYELLVGSPAFAARGITGLIQKILHEEPQPVRTVRPELPEGVEFIVRRMLEKDPSRRYRSGVELVRDIDALLIENRSDPRIFSPEEKQSRLARLTFFEGFSAQELREIDKAAQWQRVPAGAVIAGEGASETAFFLLLEGEVSQRIGDLRLHTLEVGEGFGEMEYLAGGGRSASYLAERECLLVSLERDFREWASLPCQLRLGKAFQSLLIRRLRDTTRDLARALRDG